GRGGAVGGGSRPPALDKPLVGVSLTLRTPLPPRHRSEGHAGPDTAASAGHPKAQDGRERRAAPLRASAHRTGPAAPGSAHDPTGPHRPSRSGRNKAAERSALRRRRPAPDPAFPPAVPIPPG